MRRIAAMFLCLALLSPIGVYGQSVPEPVNQQEADWKIELLNRLGVLDETQPESVVNKQTMLNGLNQIFGNAAASAHLYFEGQNLSDPLLYAQAVMILVDAMGYSHYVEMLGYDTGSADAYLKVAKRIDLIADSEAPQEEPVAVGTYAELLYRALTEIPLMVPQNYSSGEVRYIAEQDRTMLSEYMRLEKVKGVVNGADHVSNDTRDGEFWDKIKIGKQWYDYSTSEDIFAYYGYKVEAYVEQNEEKLRAVVIPKNVNRMIKLRSDDIVSAVSKSSFRYQQNNHTNTAKIAKEADVIYNRELLRDYKADDFKRKNSDYTLIDNNNDGAYEVVIIEQYASFVVEQTAVEDEKIVAVDGQIYDLSEYFKEGYRFYRADGVKTELDKAAKNNVVSYLCADSGRWTYMVLSTQRVSGVIDESRENMRYIKIDGVEYECSAQYLNNRHNHDTINIGDRVTAFFDINGFIIELRYVSSSVEAGYFMGAAETKLNGAVFRILTQAGEIKEVNGSNTIVLDGEKMSAQELLKKPSLAEKDGSFMKQLILYRKNSQNEIVRMDTAKNEDAVGGKGFEEFTLNYDSVRSGNLRALSLNGTKVLGSKYIATKESIMFGISNDEEECYVQAASGIPANSALNVKLYNVNENYEPQYIVYEFTRKLGSWVDYYVDPIMVDYICETVDQEGETVYQLNGYTPDGKNKAAYIRDPNIKTQSYNILSGDNRFLDIELKDVPRGSIVLVLEDSRGIYAFALQHVPQQDNSEFIFEKTTAATGNEYGINVHMFNGQYLLSYGKVLQRTAAGVVINNHLPTEEELAAGQVFPMKEWNRHIPLEPSDTILLYDKKNDQIYLDKAIDILPGDSIFTKRNGTAYKGLFVYR